MSPETKLPAVEHAQVVLQKDRAEVLCHDLHTDDLRLGVEVLGFERRSLDELLIDTVTDADVTRCVDDGGIQLDLVRWAFTGNKVTYVSRQAHVNRTHPGFETARRGKRVKDMARIATTAGGLVIGFAEWDFTQVPETPVFEAVRSAVKECAITDSVLRDLVALNASEYPLGFYSIRNVGENAKNNSRFPSDRIVPGFSRNIGRQYRYLDPAVDATDMTFAVDHADRWNETDQRPLTDDDRARIREVIIHRRLGMLHGFAGGLALAAYDLRTSPRMRP